MRHTKEILNFNINVNKIEKEIKRIEKSQKKENIKLIYKRWKYNHLIKWDYHLKKILGLPLPQKPGLEI